MPCEAFTRAWWRRWHEVFVRELYDRPNLGVRRVCHLRRLAVFTLRRSLKHER